MSDSTADRAHLSIREVLEVLVEEFPDVTISKIRFLESRGLIHPERTPSGYRRFYASDVERLRWILQQQRENFLPLKVIKGRLERQATYEPSLFDTELDQRADALSAEEEDPDEPVLAGLPRGASASTGTLSGSHLSGRAGHLASAPVGAVLPARVEAPAPHELVGAGSRLATGSESVGSIGLLATPVPGNELGLARRASNGGGGEAASIPEEAPTGGGRAARGGARGRGGSAHPAVEAQQAAARVGRHSAARTEAVAAAEPAEAPEPAEAGTPLAPEQPTGERHLVTGASLSAEELAAAAGVDLATVSDLVEFGLISGRDVAGVRVYDEDALIVTRLAGAFRRYGIEARHLKALRHAAEREAGLFAQVVTPLLRQRNPASHERALSQLGEMCELAASLRAHFVQAELRQLTGG